MSVLKDEHEFLRSYAKIYYFVLLLLILKIDSPFSIHFPQFWKVFILLCLKIPKKELLKLIGL